MSTGAFVSLNPTERWSWLSWETSCYLYLVVSIHLQRDMQLKTQIQASRNVSQRVSVGTVFLKVFVCRPGWMLIACVYVCVTADQKKKLLSEKIWGQPAAKVADLAWQVWMSDYARLSLEQVIPQPCRHGARHFSGARRRQKHQKTPWAGSSGFDLRDQW